MKIQIQVLLLPSKVNAEVQFTAWSFCRVFNALVDPQRYLHCKGEIQRFGFIQNSDLPFWVTAHHGLESLARGNLGRSHHTVPKKKSYFSLLEAER